MSGSSAVKFLAFAWTVMAFVQPATAQDDGPKIAIEDLLKASWQIAGYTGADDSRSTFILLRHPNETYLIQCRGGYDVTRQPRVFTNCYPLR